MGRKKRNQSAGARNAKNDQRVLDLEDIKIIDRYFPTSENTTKLPKNVRIIYDLLTWFEIEKMLKAINKLDNIKLPTRIYGHGYQNFQQISTSLRSQKPRKRKHTIS